jgi:hypothetical protein
VDVAVVVVVVVVDETMDDEVVVLLEVLSLRLFVLGEEEFTDMECFNEDDVFIMVSWIGFAISEVVPFIPLFSCIELLASCLDEVLRLLPVLLIVELTELCRGRLAGGRDVDEVDVDSTPLAAELPLGVLFSCGTTEDCSSFGTC